MIVATRNLTVQKLKDSKQTTIIEIPESLGLLDDPASIPPDGHGVIRVMTPQDGDKRVVWNSKSFAEIGDAKHIFDKLVLEGLVPYKVGTNGQATSEVMAEFDPHAEEIIFLPIALVVGG